MNTFPMKQFFCFSVPMIDSLLVMLDVEESISLSVTQRFDVERMNRAIESTVDAQQLQVLAKQLLQAWHSQRAATVWITRQRELLG